MRNAVTFYCGVAGLSPRNAAHRMPPFPSFCREVLTPMKAAEAQLNGYSLVFVDEGIVHMPKARLKGNRESN
jgi:hypothetical protein